jgi:hypothetical protein
VRGHGRSSSILPVTDDRAGAGSKKTPRTALEEPIFPEEELVTAEYPAPPLAAFSHDEEPTIERVAPAAVVAATRGEDEFRTVNVTFSEILARVGPRHLGGPLPPIREELYTTAPVDEPAPVSTAELDGEWIDEAQPKE